MIVKDWDHLTMSKHTYISNDLITQFLNHVSSSPEKLAILTSETSLTYQQLLIEVVRWKRLFNQQLNGPVVVCLQRTPRLLSVLLALQWLDITYIPIDMTMPLERVRAIIDDSQAQAILYDEVPNAIDYASLSCQTINLDQVERPLFVEGNDVYVPNQNAIVYIIYTSGSTGTPKGVAISRRALNNFFASMSQYFLNEDQALLLAITTIAFDISGLELYLPLWQQKTVFLASDSEHKDPFRISALLNDYPITLLQATPAMWTMLESLTWAGQSDFIALCGGEQLTQMLADRLLTKVHELWNMYGPTEATIWCALKRILPNEPITIGRPIDNMDMFVMDSSLQILPPDIKGELYIAGLGLAEGYVNNAELTQSRFIPYPKAPGGRLYRVGDIACTTLDGEIIVFGRTDNQVKLHGYRIELEDIEAQIKKVPEIKDCVVHIHNEQIVAHVCVNSVSTISEQMLLQQLSRFLPEYMLPKHIYFEEKLPLTISGKIDRNALLSRLVTHEKPAVVCTLTPLQAVITRIWQEELSCSSVGLDDNFFQLGGHSLLAARIIFKLSQALKKQVTLKAFYDAPTIKQLSQVIEQIQPDTVETSQLTSKMMNKRWSPLNDFQLLFWVSTIFEPSLKMLCLVDRKRIQGPLNKEALDFALQFAYQKHEALSYEIHRFYSAQRHQKQPAPKWIETKLIEDEHAELSLNASFDELYSQTPRTLNNVMLNARLFYLKNDQIELQVSLSHFVADDRSLEIFFQDLSDAYLHYVNQKPLNTKPLTHSPISYARHQHNLYHQHEKSDAAFWKHYLGDTGLFSFPAQDVIQDNTKSLMQFSTYIEMPELLIVKLHQFCGLHGVTISDVFCAAIGLSLRKSCQYQTPFSHKILMNIVKSTRDNPIYDKVIGCFLRINLIKLDLNGNLTLVDLAKQAQQSYLETIGHQRAPSLIKLASIGCIPRRRGLLRSWLISLVMRIVSIIAPLINMTSVLVDACKTLSSVQRDNHFIINVNILNSFVSDISNQKLFNRPCQKIPIHYYNVLAVKDVFDVNFFRYGVFNTPFMVISANLTPTFRQHFGETLLDVLRNETME